MKKLFVFLFIVVLIVTACEDRDDNLMAPNIRIQNLTDKNFARVEVRNDSIFYEDVTSEGFSDYLEYELAYRQDTVRVEADSILLTYIPDSLGQPLPIGLYTYQLQIDAQGELQLTFKLD